MREWSVEGAWRLRTYVVEGTRHEVDGVLLFANGCWATVFFVGAASATPWGSGEAGTYQRQGETLTFIHDHVIQGGGGRELVLTPRGDRTEHCHVEATADTLRIDFPSGSTLHLERVHPA